MERPVRIYRSRRPLKVILTALLTVLVVLAILAVSIFFGFKRYIVYTSDGVKLEVPWLQEPEEQGETVPAGGETP